MLPGKPIHREKPTILVVDDDPVQRQLASTFLGMGGYKVATAENGKVALEKLQAEQFTIALLDVEMPVMGGLELLQHIGRSGKLASMPCIMATSRDDIAVIDRAFELGASDFTVKPVNWALMLHEIRFVLRAAENERIANIARDEAVRLSQSKDDFLAVARHELRTPIQATMGFADLILKEADSMGAELIRAYAEEVSSGARRLNATFSDLLLHLDLKSRKVKPQLETERVSSLLEDAEMAVRPGLEKAGLSFAAIDGTAGMSVRVDASHVVQSLQRLTDNAVKHGVARSITLVSSCDSPGTVTIAVEDDGIGLPAGFELDAFTQADMSLSRHSEGLGLGLSIIREIVALSAGTLSVGKRADGSGTRAALRYQAL